ncbi:hypothetical protein FACS1894200_00180 [Spirochaetia bacterium]|nr:hypothetical protein FACS1894200_00180 [Spirochaetia bacterium]
MYAVKAIYDGNHFKLDESVPVVGKYEVVITFTKSLDKPQEEILKYFNSWDEDDLNCMKEIINDRDSFSLGRVEL